MENRNEKNHKKDLRHNEAIRKIREIVDHTKICLFTTRLSETPLQTRPMVCLEVDDEGNLWFFSDEESDKNMEIATDERVQLFFSDQGNSEFLSVYGHAMISSDRKRIDELWHPMVKTWFKGGKDDPALSVVMVMPEDAYYWDTKNGKMISLIKIVTSMVSGKTLDDGVEGTLTV
jgi:general stress protein 26